MEDNYNKLVDEWTDLGNQIRRLTDARNLVADQIAAMLCPFSAGDEIKDPNENRSFKVRSIVGCLWGGMPKYAVHAVMLKKDGTESLVTKEIRHHSIDNYKVVSEGVSKKIGVS